MPASTQLIDVVDALRACFDAVRRVADRRGVKASLSIPAFPERVLVDRATFRRVLIELVDQAVADGTAGAELSVTLSLSDATTLAIEVGPPTEAVGWARPRGRRAELPIQRVTC